MIISKKKIILIFLKITLSYQTVHILMKCRIMRHFIWVFTDCQDTGLGVSGPQGVKVYSYIANIWMFMYE